MGHISYLVKRALAMDYKSMFECIGRIQKETGKNPLAIFNDMRRCATLYGAGYNDYELYEMYYMNDKQRESTVTREKNNLVVKTFNQREFRYIFENKVEFNKRFSKFLKRDWLQVDVSDKEQILDFLKKHAVIFAKPLEGTGGKGIEKIKTADYNDLEELYNHLQGKNFEIEEEIIQHPQVSTIYPYAINTGRFCTVTKNGKVHIVATFLRIGNKGNYVDNLHSDGFAVKIDPKTGIINSVATNKKKEIYSEHPMTGTHFEGYQLPDWDKACAMIEEAALVVPEIGYVGWDVAFSENGPCLVEGNCFSGHDIYQLPAHTPDRMGLWPTFKAILDE